MEPNRENFDDRWIFQATLKKTDFSLKCENPFQDYVLTNRAHLFKK